MNQWIDTVLQRRYNKIDSFRISKINIQEIDSFKLVNVFVHTRQEDFNFIIATAYDKVKFHSNNDLSETPFTNFPIQARTLKTPSIDAKDIYIDYSNGWFNIKSTGRSLNFFIIYPIADPFNLK